MYERFTDQARKVMQFSYEEAKGRGQSWIDTELILLGLVRNGRGIAVKVCDAMKVDLQQIGQVIEKSIEPKPPFVGLMKIPQTPAAKKCIEFAMEEARGLSHNYVGTEHLLLGLLREQQGTAAKVLTDAGVKIEETRRHVAELTGQGFHDD